MMTSQLYDIVIIGSGPAGLSAALYSARADLKTLVIEKAGIGGLITSTDAIDNYPGSPEGSSGYSLTERMNEQAQQAGAEFVYSEVIGIVKKEEMLFEISRSAEQSIFAKAVIIACGTLPRLLGIPGEKEYRGRGVSYCATCDAGFFRGKSIAVIGGGDSAIKEAEYLTKFASDVTVIHRRDELRASEIVKKKAFANEKINFLYNSVAVEILGEGKVNAIKIKNTLDESESIFNTDGVFIFAGYEPNTQFIKEYIDCDESGYIITDEYMKTSIKGIYAAGDIRVSPLKQVITACSDGAIAATSAEMLLSRGD